MAPGIFKKIGDWFKRTVPKVARAIPKVLEVAGNVVGKVSPTAGKVLTTLGKAGQGIVDVITKTKDAKKQEQLKQQDDRNNKTIQDVQDGLQFLTPVLQRFKGKGFGAIAKAPNRVLSN